MKIIILQAGPYNDASNQAQKRNAGDEHETSEWYGAWLIENGYAALPQPALTPEPDTPPQSQEGEPEPEAETPVLSNVESADTEPEAKPTRKKRS